jgi:RHS repeat-associated protein
VNQNGILAAVKSLCRFLKIEGYLATNPAEGIEYARQPHTLPRNVLTPQEAKRIIETVDTTTVLGYRDRTILETLYATGIRNEELRNLTVADVNLEEGLLRVNHGKGGKDRVTPMGQMASRFLETYLKGIRPQLLGQRHTDRLFLSFRGHPLDAHSVGDLVKRHARLARVKKHVTPHVWRHTCATHMVKNNANLRHVQDLLGHGSLAIGPVQGTVPACSFSCSTRRQERRLRNERSLCVQPDRHHRSRRAFRKTLCSSKRAQVPENRVFPGNSRTTHLGPFGELIRATGPMAKLNPFTYQTEFYDWETDKYYWKNRYYDPSPGRFINRDPMAEPGFELIAQSLLPDNDPSKANDADGDGPLGFAPQLELANGGTQIEPSPTRSVI